MEIYFLSKESLYIVKNPTAKSVKQIKRSIPTGTTFGKISITEAMINPKIIRNVALGNFDIRLSKSLVVANIPIKSPKAKGIRYGMLTVLIASIVAP